MLLLEVIKHTESKIDILKLAAQFFWLPEALGLGSGQLVAPVVVGVVAMPLDPVIGHGVGGNQGQQLLLRYIYANCLTRRGSNAEDFEAMLAATRAGDADHICAALQANTDRSIPTLLEFVLREKAAR